MELEKLNVGCGMDVKKGYLNLDKIKLKGVDVVHDLNKFPYPLKNNKFKDVICINILEHLDDLVKFMEEIHRICRDNAVIHVRVPYFNSITANADPTHKRFFTLDSFDYFTNNHTFNFYTKARFKILEKKLEPTSLGKIVPFKKYFLNKIGIILGGFAKSIYFKLEVIK